MNDWSSFLIQAEKHLHEVDQLLTNAPHGHLSLGWKEALELPEVNSPQIAEFGFIAMMLLINSKLNHELRSSRDELMLLEARFRVLGEQAKDAIFLHDIDGRIVDVNQQACASLGYSRHELIGMNVMQIESKMTAESAQQIWKTMHDGEPVTLEGRHRRKDGSEFPIEVRIGLFHSNERDLALAIARAISDRKQAERPLQLSEQRLRTTLDNTPGVAVQWFDRTGRVLYWNTASEKLYAIPATQAIGKSMLELLHTPEQFCEFLDFIATIEKQQTTFGPAEIDITSKHGARVTVLYTMFMIPGTTDEPIFVCMDVNISDRKRAEDARQQQEHLEELVQRRTEALEAANYELKTFSYSIKKWVSDEAMKECIALLTTLNRKAAEVAAGFEVQAATDITGFGLAGHCFEMLKGSQVTMEFTMDRIPIMQEALEMYKKGVTTGVNNYNRELVAGAIRFEKDLPPWHKEIAYDPQTSGGLLVSVPESQGESLLQALQSAGIRRASMVGKVRPLRDGAHLIFK